MTIGFLLFQIFPKELLDILGPEPQTIALGIPALRIISFAFFPAAFGVIMISIFQSIDHGSKALIMSLLRQAAFLVPLAFILGKAMGIEGVWLSFPIAEALCLILFAVPLIKLIKQSFARKDAELLNAVA
jgi:Na+-driven multidrug efflux pump